MVVRIDPSAPLGTSPPAPLGTSPPAPLGAGLPILPPAFASVDGFLAYQREAVASARAVLEQDADRAWEQVPVEGRDRFVQALLDLMVEHGTAPLWRRAWWLHAIGGRPRAPFESGTPPETAGRLIRALAAALAPSGPPADRPEAVARWWRELIALCRDHIASHVVDRVASAGQRLAAEGVLDPGDAEALADGRANARPPKPHRRPFTEAERRRVRAAEAETVRMHRRLDERFRPLGPVCAACTKETGGCCSLTVPLLWREADYRLMAMGGVRPPAPAAETAGACPFLGDRGCRLPSERRPHICRSFLCDRAQAALERTLPQVRTDLERLNEARSRLG
jgi:hypothetical protein